MRFSELEDFYIIWGTGRQMIGSGVDKIVVWVAEGGFPTRDVPPIPEFFSWVDD